MTKEKSKKSLLDYAVYGAVGIGLLTVMIGAGVILYSDQLDLRSSEASHKLTSVDFTTLATVPTDPSYLACPELLCPSADPDERTPTYAVSASILRDSLIDFIDASPGLETHRIDLPKAQFDFLAYTRGGSAFVRKTIPDVVTVRFFDISPHRSSLAIYSRTPIGEAKKGEHKERVQLWLRQLDNFRAP